MESRDAIVRIAIAKPLGVGTAESLFVGVSVAILPQEMVRPQKRR